MLPAQKAGWAYRHTCVEQQQLLLLDGHPKARCMARSHKAYVVSRYNRSVTNVRAGGEALSSAAGPDDGDANTEGRTGSVVVLKASVIAAAAAALLMLIAPQPIMVFLYSCKEFLTTSVLAKSGFFASLSLIFASEIGDKTFFIAALLAMRYGRVLSFLGSVASLSLMTVISVIIGFAVQRVPAVVESSEVVGQYLSAASLLYFGIRSLHAAATQDATTSGEEFSEAEEQVASAEESGSIQKSNLRNNWAAFMEIAGLIFVAEWGDRSMLATIALGAAQSPIGVAGGAIMGHAVATLIAVLGGAALSDSISERTVNVIGGALFILFAIATMMGVF
jgi:putative Ca2+/H+ antiporter (TMEM165/GDT1 family)